MCGSGHTWIEFAWKLVVREVGCWLVSSQRAVEAVLGAESVAGTDTSNSKSS